MDINTINQAESLYNAGHSMDEIIERILHPEMNDDMLHEIRMYIQKLRFKKQRTNGFKCLTIGALLCLASCLLTFSHGNFSEMYTLFTLYGLTMIGACLLLLGLSLVLGLT